MTWHYIEYHAVRELAAQKKYLKKKEKGEQHAQNIVKQEGTTVACIYLYMSHGTKEHKAIFVNNNSYYFLQPCCGHFTLLRKQTRSWHKSFFCFFLAKTNKNKHIIYKDMYSQIFGATYFPSIFISYLHAMRFAAFIKKITMWNGKLTKK